MSILSRLLGTAARTSGDDVARAATKTAAKTVAKKAVNSTAKAAANQLDDVARVATSQLDDIARAAGTKTAKKAATTAAKKAVNNIDDAARAAANKIDDVASASAKKVAKKATRPSFSQKLASREANDYANTFGTMSQNTRRGLLDDYIGGGKVWEWGKRNNITPANLQDKVGNGLKALGGVQDDLFRYADDAGMTVNLSDLFDNNKLNALTGSQRKRLADIGLDIDSIIGGNASSVSAGKAQELYRALRDVGYKMADSADGTQKIWGKNLQDASRAISQRIDDTLAPASKSFGLKQRVTDAMTDAGLDPSRARAISEMLDDQVTPSLLRGEMAPMMKFEKLIGNKLPAEKTLNIAGIDTGLPNYISKATQAIGDVPLKVAAAAEKHPALAMTAAAGGAGLLGSLLLGNRGGGSDVALGQGLGASDLGGDNAGLGAGADYGTALSNALGLGYGGGSTGSTTSTISSSSQPTINGWSYDDLEQGYMNAMLAGDSSAAAAIQDMIEMLDNKVARQQSSAKSSGNSKAQTGINILQELYQLYNQGGGGKGVVGGTLTNLLNGVTGGSYDQNSAVYNDVMSTTLAPIIKAMGESGTLSDSDRASAEKSMPKISDAPEVAEQKFQALYRILQRAAAAEAGQ